MSTCSDRLAATTLSSNFEMKGKLLTGWKFLRIFASMSDVFSSGQM